MPAKGTDFNLLFKIANRDEFLSGTAERAFKLEKRSRTIDFFKNHHKPKVYVSLAALLCMPDIFLYNVRTVRLRYFAVPTCRLTLTLVHDENKVGPLHNIMHNKRQQNQRK